MPRAATRRARRCRRVAAPPATSRHPNHSLPLLPSGPGGICELSSREDRRSHREIVRAPPSRATGLRMLRVGWRRGRDSNPRNGLTRLHTFQACSFNHSDTSPYFIAGRDCSAHPGPHPSLRSGPAWRLSEFVPDELVEPAKRLDPFTHFPDVLLQPLGASPHARTPALRAAQHTRCAGRVQARHAGTRRLSAAVARSRRGRSDP